MFVLISIVDSGLYVFNYKGVAKTLNISEGLVSFFSVSCTLGFRFFFMTILNKFFKSSSVFILLTRLNA